MNSPSSNMMTMNILGLQFLLFLAKSYIELLAILGFTRCSLGFGVKIRQKTVWISRDPELYVIFSRSLELYVWQLTSLVKKWGHFYELKGWNQRLDMRRLITHGKETLLLLKNSGENRGMLQLEVANILLFILCNLRRSNFPPLVFHLSSPSEARQQAPDFTQCNLNLGGCMSLMFMQWKVQ